MYMYIEREVVCVYKGFYMCSLENFKGPFPIMHSPFSSTSYMYIVYIHVYTYDVCIHAFIERTISCDTWCSHT